MIKCIPRLGDSGGLMQRRGRLLCHEPRRTRSCKCEMVSPTQSQLPQSKLPGGFGDSIARTRASTDDPLRSVGRPGA
jgi:hypothetical protein